MLGDPDFLGFVSVSAGFPNSNAVSAVVHDQIPMAGDPNPVALDFPMTSRATVIPLVSTIIPVPLVGNLDPPIIMMVMVIFDNCSGDHPNDKASKCGQCFVIGMGGCSGEPNEEGCDDGRTYGIFHGLSFC